MGRMSREKGKRGEREGAMAVRDTLGFPARRGRQYRGGEDSPDIIVGVDGIHWEVKRTERLSLYAEMDQAEDEAGASVPVLLHRRNRRPWLLVMRLHDAPRFMRALLEAGWTWR